MANVDFPIYVDVQGEQTSFHDLVIKKATYESVVMSLGDKITGDVYYKDNTLKCSMQEYIEYNGVRYILVSPPTIVKEGMVSDNSELKGMTKYSFVFYHPMCKLSSIPFTDVAVSSDENSYLSDSKTFTWIGKPNDFANKLNKNLQGTEWFVHLNTDSIGEDKLNMFSDVLSFDKVFISDALKTFYDTWEIPFVIDSIKAGEYTYRDEHNVAHDWYTEGKRFVIVLGLPSNQITKSTYKICTGVTGYNGRYYFCNKAIKVSAGMTIGVDYQIPQKPDYILRANGVSQDGDTVLPMQVGELLSVDGKFTATVDTFVVLGAGIAQTQWWYFFDEVYVFKLGKGLGLKNNSRTPKNNKIVTRIIGEGSENNIPYGYPQIKWYGTEGAKFTYGDHAGVYENVTIEGHLFKKVVSYPIYKGIVDGQYVELIKHPFTRTHLMPTVFVETLFNKVSLYHLEDGQVVVNENYDPDLTLVDYYDADDDTTFPNPINLQAPSVEMHTFEDIKPELGEKSLVSVQPYYKERENFISYNDFQRAIENIKMWETTAAPQQNSLLDAWVSHVNKKTNTVGGEPVQVEWTGGAYTYKYTVTPRQDHVLATFTSDALSLTYKVKYKNYDYSEKWDDTMDENGEYKQSYFEITLPPLGFDLFACASITEAMQINMRSGACLGCTFDVYVDWEDYKRNFFDSEGNFDPDTERDYNKYPDSTEDPITLIVKKDLETFGRLMPNEYQMPKGETTEGAGDGDEFVILGISLPLSYIEDAQDRLDEAMVEYMLENNVHYYEYPLKFDEYFLTTHANILSQMRNNTVVRFQYGEGVESEIMDLYIKQMSVKYGSSPLPQYDITLADDIEIVLNQIGQVTDDVSRMRVQMSELQKYYYGNVSEIINSKLSKVADDVAQGRITFQQGIQVLQEAMFSGELRSSNFMSGLYAGKGWRIDQLGNAELESLRVRSFLEVIELLVNRMQAQEGDTLFSDNDQIERVEPLFEEYTCSQGDNPKSLNLYEIIDGNYEPTEDESVVEGKTYYIVVVGSYVLSLKEKWKGYVTGQRYGNILKGIINTLAAKQAGISDETTGEYYTSWMYVEETHNTNETRLGVNQIIATMYGDLEVPSQTNFAPCELMTIARWGCQDYNSQESAKYAAEGWDTEERARASILQRQQVFYISTSEGRIVKLNGVNKPILQNGNYGTTLGELPEFVKRYRAVAERLVDGGDYLYAQGVVVGDFIKVDVNGREIVNIVDKGQWRDNTVYLYAEWNSETLQYETHDVWHNGSMWRCLQHEPVRQGMIDTYYEPSETNNRYWQKLVSSGNSQRTIYSYSDSQPSVPLAQDQSDTYTPNNWSNEALEVSSTQKNVYISTRQKINGTWGTWSTPVLYAHYAEDGRSIYITGKAKDHYTTWAEFYNDLRSGLLTGLFLVDQDNASVANNCPFVVNAIRGTVFQSYTASVNDAYLNEEDGHLYLAQSATQGWYDIGQFKGEKGDKGDMGRNFYYDGDWVSSKPYTLTKYEAPFVSHVVSGNTNYYVRIGNDNTTWASSTPPNEDTDHWAIMVTDFKYLIAQAIFSEFARLGKWVFNNAYMFSADGIDSNNNEVTYDSTHKFFGIGESSNTYTPNVVMNAQTGEVLFGAGKIHFNPDGSGWLANKNITWEANGKTELRDNVLIGKDVIWKDLTGGFGGYIKMSASTVGLTFWTVGSNCCAEIYITGSLGGILELRAYDGSEPLQLSHTNLTYKGNNVISWDDIKTSFAKPVTGIRRMIKHAKSDVNLNDPQNQDYETIIGEQSSGTTIQVTLPTTPSDGQELLFKTYSNACPINIKLADTDYGKGIKVSDGNTMTHLLLPYCDWKNAKLVWNASTRNWDVFLMM